jgi:hypothetical protein
VTTNLLLTLDLMLHALKSTPFPAVRTTCFSSPADELLLYILSSTCGAGKSAAAKGILLAALDEFLI